MDFPGRSMRGAKGLGRAEMVVRKLEKQWVMHLSKNKAASERATLARSIDCYERGYLFVDTGVSPWRILHMNQAASDQTGALCPSCSGSFLGGSFLGACKGMDVGRACLPLSERPDIWKKPVEEARILTIVERPDIWKKRCVA